MLQSPTVPQPRILLKRRVSSGIQLPGTLELPDGKQPIRLGSGVITSLISSGGMAIVYEIWNPELEVKRAVKLLHPDHTKESEERFYTEMKITAKLHHPNIVDIYSVGRWNDLPFIEMERIDGITLYTLLSRCGRLPPEVCTAICIMVGRALNYAHSQDYVLYGKKYHGIIHRDLKPGNIMITQDGVVKLMDFGIARPMTASIHTCEGTVMGTMQYLAPEQLDGNATDARSDIYSMGTVLYEMLTGVLAFPEQNIARLVPEKLSNTFVPIEQFALKLPPTLVNIVHKCMRLERERRMQNMLEFLRTVGHVHDTISSLPPDKVMEKFVRETQQFRAAARVRKRVRVNHWFLGSGIALTLLLGGLVIAYRFPQVLSGPYALVTSRLHPAQVPADTRQQPATGDRAVTETTPPTDATVVPDAGRPETAEVARGIPTQAVKVPSTIRRTAAEPASPAPPAAAVVAPSPMSAPVTAGADAATDQPEPVNPPSLLETLSAQYRTTDVMTIFSAEVEKDNFRNALAVYSRLSKSDAATPKAVVYRLRSARGLGDREVVESILSSSDINDGEFYLERAMSAYRKKDVGQALNLIARAERMPAEFADQREFHPGLLYAKALCASTQFDANPTPAARKFAMTTWYEVKSALRSTPGHQYYTKADEEIRRVNKTEVPGE